MATTTTDEFTERLQRLLEDAMDEAHEAPFASNVASYEQVGMLTMDQGLRVRMPDGTAFAITVQQYHGAS